MQIRVVSPVTSHRDPSMPQAQRIAWSKLVPCPPRRSRRGCGAPAGTRCTSLANGQPLGGLGTHVARWDAALAFLDSLPATDRPGPDLSDLASSERPLAAV